MTLPRRQPRARERPARAGWAALRRRLAGAAGQPIGAAIPNNDFPAPYWPSENLPSLVVVDVKERLRGLFGGLSRQVRDKAIAIRWTL